MEVLMEEPWTVMDKVMDPIPAPPCSELKRFCFPPDYEIIRILAIQGDVEHMDEIQLAIAPKGTKPESYDKVPQSWGGLKIIKIYIYVRLVKWMIQVSGWIAMCKRRRRWMNSS